MDRSNSVSSKASTDLRSSSPFAYQTRLLERTSSRSGAGPSLSRTGSQRSKTDIVPPELQSPTKSPTVTPYRSSYLASKKSGSYGETLSGGSRRRLGNHLPRIASGDAVISVAKESPVKKDTELVSRHDKKKSLSERDFNVDIQMQRHNLTQPRC